MKRFEAANEMRMADDHKGAPVFLAANDWMMKMATEDWPDVRFLKTREQQIPVST
jgi:peptide chain release factor 3